MSNTKSLIGVLILSLAVAACGGRKKTDDLDVGSVNGVGGVAGDSGVATGVIGADGVYGTDINGNRITDGFNGKNAALLSKRKVYFEYDSSALTAEGQAIVQAHAEFLIGSPGVNVVLEGHTDERGTREYNLALGEERAKSVASVLQAYGVGSNRIQEVSYGEERPDAAGTDNAAYSLNRRVEILYQ